MLRTARIAAQCGGSRARCRPRRRATGAPANLPAANAVGAEASPTVHPASAARISC